ncbi:hypothetical protein MHYP_G00014120, partial [Metynnis hypsauchen]
FSSHGLTHQSLSSCHPVHREAFSVSCWVAWKAQQMLAANCVLLMLAAVVLQST